MIWSCFGWTQSPSPPDETGPRERVGARACATLPARTGLDIAEILELGTEVLIDPCPQSTSHRTIAPCEHPWQA
jgi:hypothetical protein